MPEDFTPRPYQEIVTADLLVHSRYNVWMPPGMGKTAAVLQALDILSVTDEVYPALVLGTYRIADSVWPEEVKKWRPFAHIKVSRILGSPSERWRGLKAKADIYTMNYDNLVWLAEKMGDNWPFVAVIADESTRLKSYRSRQGGARARALYRYAHGKVKRFINLTGTPNPNGLKDLWGQNAFIDGGERLGRSFTAFSQRWFQRGFDGYSIDPLPHAQAQIEGKLRDVTVSIDPKDYFDLREPVETTIAVELPPDVRKLYKDMEKKFFMEIEDAEIEAFNAATKTGKLLQLCNGAVYMEKEPGKELAWKEVYDVKIEALRSLREELAGANLLVAYHFKSDLARLKKAFPDARVLDKKASTIKDWNKGRIPMLIAHPASAGHGLNLQDGGHHLCYFGHTWDLEIHQQIAERIGPVRQLQSGHDRNVFIYHIVARNTIEEAVMERLKTKETVQNILLKAMKRRNQ